MSKILSVIPPYLGLNFTVGRRPATSCAPIPTSSPTREVSVDAIRAAAPPRVEICHSRRAQEVAKIERARLLAERETAIIAKDRLRQRLSRRADKLWVVDKQAEVARVADRIDRQSHSIVCRLKQTYHGCRLLVERWNYIREAIDAKNFDGALAEADRQAALSLLGIPKFQRGLRRYPIDPNPADLDKNSPEAVERARVKIRLAIETQLEQLESYLEVLVEEDTEERGLALQGTFLVPNRDLNKLDREIARCDRTLRKIERIIALKPTEEDAPNDTDIPATTSTLIRDNINAAAANSKAMDAHLRE